MPRPIMTCRHCNGPMFPSQFTDEPLTCLLCARTNQRPDTPEERQARTVAKLVQLAMLPPDDPTRKGRPPGAKKKVLA